MSQTTHTTKDQNWMDGTTTYWFDMDGEQFGICESDGQTAILDCDGAPMTDGDDLTRRVRVACVVTDEMRAA